MLARGALVLDQSLQIRGVFDLRATIVAARMLGQYPRPLDDAYPFGVGEHAQSAPNVGVRDRVVVQVEANIRSLAHADLGTLVPVEGVRGQRQQQRLFLGEEDRDGLCRILRTWPLGGESGAPLVGLGVQIREVTGVARSEEGFAHVADRALDAPF